MVEPHLHQDAESAGDLVLFDNLPHSLIGVSDKPGSVIE